MSACSSKSKTSAAAWRSRRLIDCFNLSHKKGPIAPGSVLALPSARTVFGSTTVRFRCGVKQDADACSQSICRGIAPGSRRSRFTEELTTAGSPKAFTAEDFISFVRPSEDRGEWPRGSGAPLGGRPRQHSRPLPTAAAEDAPSHSIPRGGKPNALGTPASWPA